MPTHQVPAESVNIVIIKVNDLFGYTFSKNFPLKGALQKRNKEEIKLLQVCKQFCT